eukprot:scaffold2999_cov1377-Pavlova_lutheri.AAC.1
MQRAKAPAARGVASRAVTKPPARTAEAASATRAGADEVLSGVTYAPSLAELDAAALTMRAAYHTDRP